MNRIRRATRALALAGAAAALTAPLAAAGTAHADEVIRSFTAGVVEGPVAHFAGAHPDVVTDFMYQANADLTARFNARNSIIELPPGLMGNPNAVPKCTHEAFIASLAAGCDRASIVGTARLTLLGAEQLPVPVFNIEPRGDEPARVGFHATVPIEIAISSRSQGDFGLTNVPGLTPPLALGTGPVSAVRLTLWGVPHADANAAISRYAVTPGQKRLPFMTNPTRCGEGTLTTRLSVDTWETPDVWHHATADSPRPTHCEEVPFDPSIEVTVDTPQADSPSGVRVDVRVPQNDDPNGRASSHLRKAVVTLPAGMALAPATATRLEGCTPEQFGKGSNDAVRCPAASQLGTTEVDSPILPGLLSGEIYLAQPTAERPYRIYQVARGHGIVLKLIGDIAADPATGQLTATFDDLPEVPFSRFTLQFKGGTTAPLTTPPTCGPQTTQAALTPWSGTADRQVSSTFQTTGCAPGAPLWQPGFTAGAARTTAGATSAFTTTVTRADGQATLQRIALRLPAGLTGYIARVPLCSVSAGAAGTCGEGSRIGSVAVAAGAGGAPLSLPGRVYLTEGYGGSPFGLSIVVPAVAGPFDLGTVVVPARIDVDRTTTALSIASEPLPSILRGIPLKIRSVSIAIDRDGFMRNPTSCAPKAIGGTIGSVERGDAAVSARFQVADCGTLPFAPRLHAKLTGGRRQMRAGRFPGLDVLLTQAAGEANARSVAFTLPSSIAVNPPTLRVACTQADYAAGSCDPLSRVGTVTAITPLLRDPLRGTVTLVQQPGRLPKLAVPLKGQVSLDLEGQVRIVRGRLRTTFASPDVPLSRFRLSLRAGRGSLLTPNANVCRVPRRGPVNAVAHSGKRVDRTVGVRASCGGGRAAARARARAGKVRRGAGRR